MSVRFVSLHELRNYCTVFLNYNNCCLLAAHLSPFSFLSFLNEKRMKTDGGRYCQINRHTEILKWLFLY